MTPWCKCVRCLCRAGAARRVAQINKFTSNFEQISECSLLYKYMDNSWDQLEGTYPNFQFNVGQSNCSYSNRVTVVANQIFLCITEICGLLHTIKNCNACRAPEHYTVAPMTTLPRSLQVVLRRKAQLTSGTDSQMVSFVLPKQHQTACQTAWGNCKKKEVDAQKECSGKATMSQYKTSDTTQSK